MYNLKEIYTMGKIFTFHNYEFEISDEKIKDFNNFLLYLAQKYFIEIINESSFALKCKETNKYVTAFPDGKIIPHANSIQKWEKFYILSDAEVEAINTIIENKYKDINGEIISEYSTIIENDKILIKLNTMLYSPSFIPQTNIKIKKKSVEIKNQNFDYKFSNQKKLVYFCTYGKDEYYECLKLSLLSLIDNGDYTGDILIKCDNLDYVKSLVKSFDTFQGNFILKEINKNLGIFNRYLIENEFYNYDIITYMDSDIITIRNIGNFLEKYQHMDLVAFNGIDKSKFDNLLKDRNIKSWYGIDYLKSFSLTPENANLLNSGFFIINNLNKIVPIFNKIIELIFLENLTGDQPFFNIALYNVENLKLLKLNPGKYLIYSRSESTLFYNLDKIFIHYNSGVGNLTKLDLMTKNYKDIQKK